MALYHSTPNLKTPQKQTSVLLTLMIVYHNSGDSHVDVKPQKPLQFPFHIIFTVHSPLSAHP